MGSWERAGRHTEVSFSAKVLKVSCGPDAFADATSGCAVRLIAPAASSTRET